MSKPIQVGCITYKSFAEACRKRNVDYMMAYMRIHSLGWSVSQALTAVDAKRSEAIKEGKKLARLPVETNWVNETFMYAGE